LAPGRRSRALTGYSRHKGQGHRFIPRTHVRQSKKKMDEKEEKQDQKTTSTQMLIEMLMREIQRNLRLAQA
jgi:hypothetical protein